MQSLWRRTTHLFWEYPALWLPVLCADFVNFWLKQIRNIATHQVLIWVSPHSVFSNAPSPIYPGSPASTNYLWASAPILWVTNLAFLYSYVIAFRLTADHVNARLQEKPLTLRDSLSNSIRQPAKTLQFLLILVLLIVGMMVLGASPYAFKMRPASVDIDIFIRVVSIIQITCVALLIAPNGLKLIRSSQLEPLTAPDKRSARVFAALAVFTSAILGFAGTPVGQRIYVDLYPYAPKAVIEMVGSLMAAIPYIPLFIALTLIATDSSKAVRFPEPTPDADPELPHLNSPSPESLT